MEKVVQEREYRESADGLLEFIQRSPSCFHVVENAARLLEKAGFRLLSESGRWELSPGGAYYVVRNGSSLIAFRTPRQVYRNFQMICSHTDSPTFKVKEIPELEGGGYIRLNVKQYGGMPAAAWFDRPLSVAGRLMVRTPEGVSSVLADVDRNLLVIPSIAGHLYREAGEGGRRRIQKELCPLFAQEEGGEPFLSVVAGAAGVQRESILGADLYLYNREPGTYFGASEEFLASPKLDDLECLYGSLRGFLQAADPAGVAMFCAFDNEEVGSRSRQGAASPFLKDVLERVNAGLGGDAEQLKMALASSFMVSADNAHALHPGYPEKYDAKNRPRMNGGLVIKYNAAQKYATDARSAALFRLLCERAAVPCQVYVNHSDIAGGSTLGNVANTQVAMYTVDVGLAQLAMHAPYETAGAKDVWYLERVAREFFSSVLRVDAHENVSLG